MPHGHLHAIAIEIKAPIPFFPGLVHASTILGSASNCTSEAFNGAREDTFRLMMFQNTTLQTRIPLHRLEDFMYSVLRTLTTRTTDTR